ncbi:hypothetical protein LTR85_012067 [Meristemomyces frigidus]|nr:hypothetical protein LTR85_012067 [Meristemomyces frigidus]
MGKASDLFRSDRYRSQAKLHAGRSTSNNGDGNEGPVLPLHRSKTDTTRTETGGLDEKDGRGGFQTPSAAGKQRDGGGTRGDYFDGGRDVTGGPEASTRNNTADAILATTPPPAPPPDKSEDAGDGVPAVTPDGKKDKPPITTRFIAGCKRFGVHTKNALFHSWVNVLLVFVPIGIIMKALGLNASLVFAMNAVAIVPLAGMLSHATESVASRMGDTLGALLNVSFGNAVELIIFIIALVKNEINIVQASLLGSILANLLLILGMAFLFGGLRFREQIYNSTVTQMSACLVSLSVMSLLLPTAFHASFNDSSTALADIAVLKVSRGSSVILLLVYFLYLLFQLKSHAYMYESTPQAIIDEESHPGVLHDIMNSSSSSDDSSSSDSTDSDTSGSIMTTGKKFRNKVFRRRSRRKSSASVSSTTPSSAVQSVLSSPSVERQGSYWEAQVSNHQAVRRESALGVIASGDEGDAEQEEGRQNIMPRIRDFVPNTEDGAPAQEDIKSPERGRFRRKAHKKHHKKRRHHDRDEEKEAAETQEKAAAEEKNAALPSGPKVGFADDVQVVQSQSSNQQADLDQAPGKLPFNMRQLSSRVAYRPALPKMLSTFNTPAPPLDPPRRLAHPVRSRANASGLRRASSLPEMQREASAPTNTGLTYSRADPVPPFIHMRTAAHRVVSENDAATTEAEKEDPVMSRTAAVVLLLCSTVLVAVCAEFMVDAIPDMIADSPVSQAFIGLIILPIVGNAAEHVTAVTVATKNKMDLAIGVAVGSSIQIALFVTPIVVLLGWCLDKDMSLYFNLFETIALFATAFVVNFLILDGRSNYLEGSLLIAAYVIIALGAFFYPSVAAQSAVGGAGTD